MPSAHRARICTVIAPSDLAEMKRGVEKAFAFGSDYVEVRFDYLGMLDVEELRRVLKNYADRCVYTCRSREEGGLFKGGEDERLTVLRKLSEQGPAFIDVELNAVKKQPDLVGSLKAGGASLIVSWHDFSGTPGKGVLKSVYKEAARFGDVAKIVTFAKSFSDNASILSLYRSAEKGRLIAFCMGERGVVSRVLCALIGSPFTYASLEDRQTAPGQIPVKELREIYAAL